MKHLYWQYRGLQVFLSSLQRPVQRGSGYLECVTDIQNRVATVIELFGNASFLDSNDCWPAAFVPSGAGCG